MTPRRLFFIAAVFTMPAWTVLGQTNDPYQTQYLDSSGPRLKVEPRPTPPPARFRFQPDARATDTTYTTPYPATTTPYRLRKPAVEPLIKPGVVQKNYETIYETPVIQRPGGPPRVVAPPIESTEPVSEERFPSTPSKPQTGSKGTAVIKKEAPPRRVVTEPIVQSKPEPAPTTVKKTPAPLFMPRKPVSHPVEAPESAVTLDKPSKLPILESTVDSTEDAIIDARETESESIGLSDEESMAIVSDDGSFRSSRIPVRVTVDLRQGYDTNVFTEPTDPEESWFTNFGARATYEFGTSRTQGLLDLSGGYTYYYDRAGDPDDFDIRFGGQITHRVTPKLVVRANTYIAYEVQPDYGAIGGSNRRSGSYFYTNSEFGAAYTWTRRFSTDTSYRIGSLIYTDNSFGRFENRVEHTFSESFRFLVLPTTVAVLEYRLGVVDYLNQSFRDSISNFVLAGADHSFSSKLSGSFRAGAEFRINNGAGNQTSPFFEGNLRYQFTGRTSAELRTRYGLEQSDVASDIDREVFRIGMAATHGFTARISSYMTLDYNHSTYQEGTGFDEDTVDTSLGVRYMVNRNFSLELAYMYTTVMSGVPGRDYDRQRTFMAARFQF